MCLAAGLSASSPKRNRTVAEQHDSHHGCDPGEASAEFENFHQGDSIRFEWRLALWQPPSHQTALICEVTQVSQWSMISSLVWRSAVGSCRPARLWRNRQSGVSR